MKKLFALLTALALMLSLASCGGQKSDPENDAENIQNEQTDSTEQEDTAPEETTPEEGAPEETEPETDGEQMPEEQPDEQPAPEEETPQAQEGITLSGPISPCSHRAAPIASRSLARRIRLCLPAAILLWPPWRRTAR